MSSEPKTRSTRYKPRHRVRPGRREAIPSTGTTLGHQAPDRDIAPFAVPKARAVQARTAARPHLTPPKVRSAHLCDNGLQQEQAGAPLKPVYLGGKTKLLAHTQVVRDVVASQLQ